MPKSMIVDSLEFSSIKECEEYTRKLLQECFNQNVYRDTSPEAFDFLFALFSRLPKFAARSHAVKHFAVESTTGKSSRSIQVTTYFSNHHMTYSWKDAIRGESNKKEKEKLKSAMRFEIQPQINDFIEAFKEQDWCSHCGSYEVKHFEIDHAPPTFKALMDEWIKNCGLTIPTKFKYKEIGPNQHRYTFSGNTKFAKGWFDYHKANCVLQKVCRKCNGSTLKKSSK